MNSSCFMAVESDYRQVIGLLAEDRRMDIIYALIDHRGQDQSFDGLTHTELYTASGIDDKGNFNYHLDLLLETVIEKDSGRYDLTQFGELVSGALLAGITPGAVSSLEVDDSCPGCGSTVLAVFNAGKTVIRCEDGHLLLGSCLPPGTADGRTGDEVYRLACRHFQQVIELSLANVCAKCYGRETGSFEPVDHDDSFPYRYRTHCHRCGHGFATCPYAMVLRHPATISFCHEHGIDPLALAPWELPFDDVEQSVVTEDPPLFEVVLSIDDEVLRLHLDRAGTVIETHQERSKIPAAD